MSDLQGKHIALACWRRATELAQGIEKLGGIPLRRPTMRTLSAESDPELQHTVAQLVGEGADWFLFTTGTGVRALVDIADRIGCRAEFVQLLHHARVAARGYKTAHALRQLGISNIVRDRDGTVASLLAALDEYDLNGTHIAVQAPGEPMPEVILWAHHRQARMTEILPYRHVPAPPEELETLLEEILRGQLDAVLFTSPPQVRFLWDFAQSRSREDALQKAFQELVLAVAVGHVTAEALIARGVSRVITPPSERMGAALVALAQFFSRHTPLEGPSP